MIVGSLTSRIVVALGMFVMPAGFAAAQELEEIVVTAQKREESVQRVPIAIAAYQVDRLEALGIANSANLAAITPGVTIDNIVGYAEVYIRGIGNDLTQGVDSSVALHLDGVYIPQLKEQLQDLVALERVEVLRGPQGTLYGRNATGGAVNIITKNPDLAKRAATVTLGVGNFSEKRGSLYLSTPFSDTLAGNLAFSYKNHNPYDVNLTPGHALEDQRDLIARGKIRYRPSDALDIVLAANGSSHHDADSVFNQQLNPNSVGGLFGGRQTDEPNRTYNDITPFSHSKFQLYSLRVQADFAAMDVVSLTGYQRSSLTNHTDFDATDAFVFNFGVDSKQSAYSQEFQFLSKPDSKIRWIGGLYYLHNEFKWLVRQESPFFAALTPELVQIGSTRDTTESASAFGEVTFPFTDALNLTAGIRYTHEEKKVPLATVTYPGIPSFDFSGASKTWTKLTPKISLTYQINPDVMLWGSVGRGFKSGGFNTSNPFALGPVNPEVLDAVELGVKSDLFDKRIRLNAQIFHYKAKDLQVQFIPATGTQVQNAASSKLYGGEIELTAAVTESLRLGANVAYLHGIYDDYAAAQGYPPYPGLDANGLAPATDLTTVHSPKYTANVTAEYVVQIGNGDTLAFNGIYAYKDKYKFDPLGQTEQPGYGILNGSIGYTTLGKKLKVSVWGSNLTDEHFFSIKNISSVGTFGSYAAPRTYGLTLTYDFL
jgi:iron complex outermembrane recepter protein